MSDTLLRHLAVIGLSPRLIFDIGAYEGTFIAACKALFPAAACWAFEPNPAKHAVLSSRADRVFPELLSDTAGELAYWEAEIAEQSGNSIFREHTNLPFRPTRRQAVTIDSLVGGAVPDLVKLDTQGSELAILKGGSASICQAECVILEVSFRRYNDRAPLFPEVMGFMAARGYQLIDMEDALRVGGILIQSNALFLKRGSPRFTEDVRVELTF
jgi:FkbM family methyltransferase